MSGILFIFHCGSNTGYAIKSLEQRFLDAAAATTSLDRIFFAYPDISKGNSESIPDTFSNIIEFDHFTQDQQELEKLGNFVRDNDISVIFGFDQPVSRSYYKIARKSGVKRIIAYWGAPISSINSGLRLLLKKLDVARYRQAPELYIFESQAMSDTATRGRGIPERKVETIYLGVDTEKFCPDVSSNHAYQTFNIPRDKKIIFYSGHLEARKGVAVIMEAANELLDTRNRQDLHFVLLGNQAGEEQPYVDMLSAKASENVTFGGYRNDVDKILPACYGGCIASTGWDSFTMSSLEMASCGLPLVVSDLQGLVETVEHGETGFQFTTGVATDLADKLETLLEDQPLRDKMSVAARQRVVKKFSKEIQVSQFTRVLTQALKN